MGALRLAARAQAASRLPMRRTFLALLIPLLAAGCSGERSASYQGYVEGEFVHLGASVGGRLEKLLVQRGQSVTAGASLFRLEAESEAAARRQAGEQLRAAQAQLADLQRGRRVPEVAVTEAQLAQARAAEAQAAQQVRRDEAQFEAGGIARAQVEDSRADLAVKSARVRELASQVAVSRLPAREEQIRAQAAQVAAARASTEQSDWRLRQTQVSAPQAGVVADTLYREGEWVPAGGPIVRLLPPQNVKVRFFVPQAVAGGLKPGRRVLVRCDGCESEVEATVRFIATEPEFTPPVIYSNETRARLVFLVEAQPAEGQAQRLRPGQPVAVTLP